MTFTGTYEAGLGPRERLCSLQTERAAVAGMTGRQRIGTARAARKDNVRVEAPRGVTPRLLDRAARAESDPPKWCRRREPQASPVRKHR